MGEPIKNLLRKTMATLTSLLRPICISTTCTIFSKYPLYRTQFSTTLTPLLFPRSLSSSLTLTRAITPTLSLPHLKEEEQQEQEDDLDVDKEIEESEAEERYETENLRREERESFGAAAEVKLPTLTVKEKKELASYAHSLGKKLKSQLVGKSGVTQNVVSSFIETLEANELLKIKIHGTCPGELEDVVKQLEEATGSVVVGRIGRTIIIYRPSLTKMKSEEKKRQARRVFVRKEAKLSPALQKSRQFSQLSGSGRRGSSRF